MPTASALRAQIEAALADRIPSALSPAPRVVRPIAPTGIPNVDALLHGGLPLGAIDEPFQNDGTIRDPLKRARRDRQIVAHDVHFR